MTEPRSAVSSRWPVIPLILGLGVAGWCLAIAALFRGGVGWDSGIDTAAAIEVRSLPTGIDLRDAYELVYSTSEFYGILIQQLADVFNRLTGGPSGLLSASELRTYQLQGVISLTLMAAAAAALGWAVRAATQSRTSGAMTFSLVLTTPLVMGLAQIDYKDSPVAAGVTMLSAALILSRRREGIGLVMPLVLAALGSAVAMGTRAGAWPLLSAIAIGSLMAFLVADLLRGEVRRSARALLVALAAAGGSIVLLILTNPFARIDLPRWLFDSFFIAKSYPWDGMVRLNGVDVPATNLPWWYAPAYMGVQLPIVTLLAAAAGIAVLVASLLGQRWGPPKRTLVDLTPLAIQGVVLPVGIVLAGSVLYDGVRHLLFAIPAWLAIASLSVLPFTADAARSRWRGMGAALAVIAVLAGLVGCIRWFPYAYAHLNPVASAMSEPDAWELDFWGSSAREGVERLRAQGLERIVVIPELPPQGYRDIALLSPNTDLDSGAGPVGVYVFHRFGETLPEGCTRAFTIERAGELLGEGGVC